jgi:hypothetical protein
MSKSNKFQSLQPKPLSIPLPLWLAIAAAVALCAVIAMMSAPAHARITGVAGGNPYITST